jgi:hypothetical protein
MESQRRFEHCSEVLRLARSTQLGRFMIIDFSLIPVCPLWDTYAGGKCRRAHQTKPNGYIGLPFKLRDSSCRTDNLCLAGLLVTQFSFRNSVSCQRLAIPATPVLETRRFVCSHRNAGHLPAIPTSSPPIRLGALLTAPSDSCERRELIGEAGEECLPVGDATIHLPGRSGLQKGNVGHSDDGQDSLEIGPQVVVRLDR